MITPQQIIERLYQIKDNPGVYKSLSAEEQADILLFILTPKPLLKKTAKLEKFFLTMEAHWETFTAEKRQRLVKIEALLKQL